MSHTKFELTDAALSSALAGRATGPHTANELVSAVAERIDSLPQAGWWPFTIGSQRRYMMAVAVGLAIGALGLAAVGSRPTETTTEGPLIAYVSGEVALEPCSPPCYETFGSFRIDHRSIVIFRGEGAAGRVSIPIPGTVHQEIDAPNPGPARIPSAPVFSPDGKMLAFRLYDDRPGIYVVNADGTGLRMVTATRDVKLAPRPERPLPGLAWSPDGKRIAFLSPGVTATARGTVRTSLAVVEVDSGAVATIVDPGPERGVGASFAWSPDGTRFAFTRDYVGDPIWNTNLGWSGIVVVKADGTGEERLTSTESGPNTHVSGFAWSPDGSRIALIRRLQPESGGPAFFEPVNVLSVVDADGANRRDLRIIGGGGCCVDHSIDGHVAWSPDGSTIAVPGVSLVRTDGSRMMSNVVESDWYAWSPDGTDMLITATDVPTVNGQRLEFRLPQVFGVNLATGQRRWFVDGDYGTWGPTTP